MINIDGVDFGGFLGKKEAMEVYKINEERLNKLVYEGYIRTYCLPSDEKVFSRKELEREVKRR